MINSVWNECRWLETRGWHTKQVSGRQMCCVQLQPGVWVSGRSSFSFLRVFEVLCKTNSKTRAGSFWPETFWTPEDVIQTLLDFCPKGNARGSGWGGRVLSVRVLRARVVIVQCLLTSLFILLDSQREKKVLMETWTWSCSFMFFFSFSKCNLVCGWPSSWPLTFRHN